MIGRDTYYSGGREMAFEKWVKPKRIPPRNHSWLTDLGIGESYFVQGKTHSQLYNRVYKIERKHKRVYEYMDVTNGCIVKRVE